jgi:DNA polymerase III alpha subunit
VKVNNYGQVLITDSEAFESIYTGKIKDLTDVYLENTKSIVEFNQAKSVNADRISELTELVDLDITIEEFDKANCSNWFIPDKYKNFNIVEFLLDNCQNEEQYARVVSELELFYQYNMIEVLIYCKYLVDTMRENNILWGVGRGSSVASYCLYLLGVHKIDSIKYNLDINEFLK